MEAHPQPQVRPQSPPSYAPTAAPVTGYPYQSNTAYPYHQPPPPYYHPPPPQYIANLRRLFILVIAVFLFFATVALIIWFVLRPRLPEFNISSARVSNFNVSLDSVTGDWDFRFSSRNPNKKLTIYYDKIESDLFYRSAFLSLMMIAPFAQGTGNVTEVDASFVSRGNFVGRKAVSGIGEDLKGGVVAFDVRIVARLTFSKGTWRMRRHYLKVLCPKVKVKMSSSGNGTLMSGNWECRDACHRLMVNA